MDFQQVCFNISRHRFWEILPDFLLTSLPDPLKKDARFHQLGAFLFFSLQFELALLFGATVCCPISRTPLFPDTSTLRFCISL